MTDTFIRRTYEPLKFLGRFFWVPLHVEPQTSFFSVAPTWEETGKQWSPTVVVRIPLTRWAVGLGWWRNAPGEMVVVHEDDALYDAYCAVNGEVPREKWSEARKEIAALGLEPEDEMALMQDMGVFS